MGLSIFQSLLEPLWLDFLGKRTDSRVHIWPKKRWPQGTRIWVVYYHTSWALIVRRLLLSGLSWEGDRGLGWNQGQTYDLLEMS